MPPKTRFDERVTVSYTTDSLDADSLAGARGKINTNEVTMTVKGISRTFPEKSLKLINAPWKTSYSASDGSYTAYSVSIEMVYRADTWVTKIIDAGLRKKNPDDATRPSPCTYAGGQGNVTSPVPLDGSGGQLDLHSGDTKIVFFPDPDMDPHYIDDDTDFGVFLDGI